MADIEKTGSSSPAWLKAVARARTVREYLSLENPTVADAALAAAKLNISKRSFYYLVKAFRVLGERPVHSVPRPARVSKEIEKIIAGAIEKAGADAPINKIGRIARAEAAKLAIQPPANKTIASRVRAARGESNGGQEEGRLIIDSAPMEVPVALSGGRAVPYATIVIDSTSHRPVGVSLSLEEPGPETVTHALMQSLGFLQVTPMSMSISIPPKEQDRWTDLLNALQRAGIQLEQRSQGFGSQVGRLLGNRLAEIPLRPRLGIEEIIERTKNLPAVPIGELDLYIRQARPHWRAARGCPPRKPAASTTNVAARVATLGQVIGREMAVPPSAADGPERSPRRIRPKHRVARPHRSTS
ncbi:hypothetical protein LPN01_15220 [Sphingomonas sp. A2-49]|uniref:hypothetical protein n=1 Tax=Sphingomonas sp. A2-49 TaxID=1391375 RepID=UPI0021D36DB5|nr:hypothetical protein [Sphingomonas sp. A2-49]MCU6455431.1 hypothetical protein [Sphingomonas sp. A2-49]